MKNNFDFILFGATGDLANKKLFPSLYSAFCKNLLHDDFKIIATGRKKLSLDEFVARLEQNMLPLIKDDYNAWGEFLKHLDYVDIDIDDLKSFEKLKLRNVDVVVYFSISPNFFIKACENLSKIGLKNARIVLEKPLGLDLKSCKSINDEVLKYFSEDKIYRIDHYLGKESVQNILFFRKNNIFIENILNKDNVSNIQIFVYESFGVLDRGEFYDGVGAIKDMIQNHMLQLLTLLCMELPQDLTNDLINDKKIDFLKSLSYFDDDMSKNIIKAQYLGDENHKAYKDELNVDKSSTTETFAALRLKIDNHRWNGVRVYLKTGKRMKDDFVKIVINFKDKTSLVFSIQPEYEIYFNAKFKANDENLLVDKKIIASFGTMPKRAYEKLLLDVIAKNQTLFVGKDELELSWKFLEPILEYPNHKIYTYNSFTNGATCSDELLMEDDVWSEDV